MPGSSSLTLFAIVMPIALLVLGAGLMKVGFWPPRRGNTPHCRGCGYALVGNESGTCSECGRPWTAATVVHGERPRHNGIGFAGLFMVLLGITFGGGLWLSDVDWYHYLPESWIVRDAGSSNSTLAKRAWDELLRRRSIAPLSENVEKKLTELALKEQAAASPAPMLDPMLQFVAQRFVEKKLSDQEADQFFLNSINPALHTRAIVAAGDVVPVQITFRGRGPTNGWSYQIKEKDVSVGGKTIRMGGSMGGSGLGAAGSSTTYAAGQPPGEYPMEAHIRLEIFHSPLGSAVSPVWARDLALKSTLKVVSQKAEEMVKLTDRPELAGQIKKSLLIEHFTRQPDGSYEVSVKIDKPPMNVAFSVFVPVAGKELRLGDFAADPTTNMGTFLHPYNIGQIPLGKVKLIFRSDPAVARKTIDLVEIWKGEVVIEDVELKEKGK